MTAPERSRWGFARSTGDHLPVRERNRRERCSAPSCRRRAHRHGWCRYHARALDAMYDVAHGSLARLVDELRARLTR